MSGTKRDYLNSTKLIELQRAISAVTTDMQELATLLRYMRIGDVSSRDLFELQGRILVLLTESTTVCENIATCIVAKKGVPDADYGSTSDLERKNHEYRTPTT